MTTRLLLILSAWLLLSQPGYAQDVLREDPEAETFIQEFSQKYKISEAWLHRYLDPIVPNETVLDAILPPTTPKQRSWSAYRARFNKRVAAGLTFWRQHEKALSQAEKRFGVPAEIIVAIIGVETHYGRNKGRFSVLRSLATLAFRYPPRAPYFREELEHFLLFCREMQIDPDEPRGSYAGAIGIPQFMPGSIRRYAVDFDGDGIIDLASNPIDAIGSVANFLVEHGWVRGGPVTQRATVHGDPSSLLTVNDPKPALSLRELAAAGVTPSTAALAQDDELATLVDLPDVDKATEYWLGYQNFYAITRYNRSFFYAMSVFQLAESLREARLLTQSAKPAKPTAKPANKSKRNKKAKKG